MMRVTGTGGRGKRGRLGGGNGALLEVLEGRVMMSGSYDLSPGGWIEVLPNGGLRYSDGTVKYFTSTGVFSPTLPYTGDARVTAVTATQALPGTATRGPVIEVKITDKDGKVYGQTDAVTTAFGDFKTITGEIGVTVQPLPPPSGGSGTTSGGLSGLSLAGGVVTTPISPETPRIRPTGNVRVYKGDNLLVTQASYDGNMLIQLPAMAQGSHEVRVVYGGDVNFDGSSAEAVAVKVVPSLTKTSILASPWTVVHGNSTRLIITASTLEREMLDMTGTLVVHLNGQELARLAPGEKLDREIKLPAGNHLVSAQYLGNHVYQPSATQATVRVLPDAWAFPPGEAPAARTPVGRITALSQSRLYGWVADPDVPVVKNKVEKPIRYAVRVDGRVVDEGEATARESAAIRVQDGKDVEGHLAWLKMGKHYVELIAFDSPTGKAYVVDTATLEVAQPLFDENLYLQANPDVAKTWYATFVGGNQLGFATPWEHYVRFGQYEGRKASAEFNEAMYLRENGDVAGAIRSGAIGSGFMHFLLYGQQEGRRFSRDFDEGYYREQNRDVVAAIARGAFRSGYEHYFFYGAAEERNPTPWYRLNVDVATYLSANPDIKAAFDAGAVGSVWHHFKDYGVWEGRSGVVPEYVEATYLTLNPDVASAVAAGRFESGLVHYLRYGRAEGRRMK